MKIIKNKWIPFGSYSTINLFGILFTKSDYLSEKTINHESIHTAQMKEMFYLPFYIWYGVEYLIIRFFHKTQNDGYHDISFEEEAYNNDDNIDYLKNRKPFAWLEYIKPRSYKK